MGDVDPKFFQFQGRFFFGIELPSIVLSSPSRRGTGAFVCQKWVEKTEPGTKRDSCQVDERRKKTEPGDALKL